MTTPSPDAAQAAIRKARGALARYRVMAIITGVMLLILCVEMLMKYVFHVSPEVMAYVRWIPFAHGWIYVVYLVTVVMLWNQMRWTWRRLISMVLAGVVPVMSFIVERTVHADADRTLGDLEATYSVTP